MQNAYVAGAATTRFGKFPGATVRSLTEEAVAAALADAGMTARDIEAVYFGNAADGVLSGQEMIRGQAALRHTGLLGVPIVNVENACASSSTAFHLAVAAVDSGSVDVALAVGAEKLTHPDKTRSFAAIGAAVDLLQLDELKAWSRSGTPENADDSKKSFFMDIYAANTRAYMARTGATREDFAEVAVKSHRHASLNPNAQYRTPVTAEEVLTSRMVSDPLTLLMCSPIGDGSAAIVVCSPRRARSLPGPAVRVRASVLVSGSDRPNAEPAAARASAAAYERAGLGPQDLDVVEVHDAAAPAELMVYEELGLCGPGEGPALLKSGATALGGRLPVNPSGGLLSRGHPLGATGCAQLVELTGQLRGRCGPRQVPGARVALAENGGGFLGTDPAAMVVTILTAD
ncbi:thiolase family protein [Streptomyces sp. UG1]|uniref:thiolase family protein n=1 Tax=Streptomyces sp. UG1 TaxID=3417652 RepID=UPI003CF38D6F